MRVDSSREMRSTVASAPVGALAGPGGSDGVKDGTNLDVTRRRPGITSREFDGLIEISTLQDVEAAELLLGVSEWSIGDQRLTVAHADRRRRGRRLQGSTA